jgi:hypothetical protein
MYLIKDNELCPAVYGENRTFLCQKRASIPVINEKRAYGRDLAVL